MELKSKGNFRWKSDYWLLLYPFLVVLLAFWQVNFFQYAYKYDAIDQFFPTRQFIGLHLHQGEVPWWCPPQNLGYPIFADLQSGFWYPVVWLFGLLTGYNLYAFHLDMLLHFFIAAAGMLFLLKQLNIRLPDSVLFATAFACCGVFFGNIQHMSYIISMAWQPWVVACLLLLLRQPVLKHAIPLSLVLFLFLTGGYPANTIITVYICGIFTIAALIIAPAPRLKIISQLAVAGVLFLLLSSGYIASLLYIGDSYTRSGILPLEKALEGPFSPQSLISFLLPFAITKEADFFDTDLSMANAYIGLLPLVFYLAVIPLRKPWTVRIFFWAGIFCLLASMGNYLPLREWLYHYFPLMDKFRFPAVFRLFFMMSAVVCGAYAFSVFRQGKYPFPRYLFSIAVLLIGAVAVHTIMGFLRTEVFYIPNFFHGESYYAFFNKASIWNHIAVQGCVQLFILGILFWLLLKKKPVQSIFPLAVLVGFELFLAVQLNIFSAGASEARFQTFKTEIQPFREQYLQIDNSVPLNKMQQFYPQFYPAWYNHPLYAGTIGLGGFNSFRLKMIEELEQSGNMPELFQNPLIFAEGGDAELRLQSYSPTKAYVRVEANQPVMLVYQQINFKGWKAEVNGAEVPVQTVHQSLVGVQLADGVQDVVLKYRPVPVIAAGIVAVLTFLIVTLWLILLLMSNRIKR